MLAGSMCSWALSSLVPCSAPWCPAQLTPLPRRSCPPWRRLQHQILQTAIKVVKRQGTAAKAAASGTSAAGAAAADASPTRRLQFEGGPTPSMDAYVAHIEQGLGQALRRLEKKVDGVTAALDQVRRQAAAAGRQEGNARGSGRAVEQALALHTRPALWTVCTTHPPLASLAVQNALELLEARLAGGVLQVEARLAVLEERVARQPAAVAVAPGARLPHARLCLCLCLLCVCVCRLAAHPSSCLPSHKCCARRPLQTPASCCSVCRRWRQPWRSRAEQ